MTTAKLPRRLLYAWEWGAGISHLKRFVPFATRLVEEGVEVTVAAKDLTNARLLFPDRRIQLRQAPTNWRPPSKPFIDPRSLASLAWNLGYDSPARILSYFDAWTGLIRDLRSEAVVADFGIMPLLVAKALELPTARLGVGFEHPPGVSPFACFGPSASVNLEGERDCEKHLLDLFNSCLLKERMPRISSLASILPSAEHTILLTVPELDPYANQRGSGQYHGWWDADNLPGPSWPNRLPRRAIAYLKPIPNLARVLQCLCELGIEVALVPDGIPDATLQSLDEQKIRIQTGLVDFAAAASQSDLVITNGNHGATFTGLVSGTPVVLCPSFVEQRLTGMAVSQARLGVMLDVTRPENFLESIQNLANSADAKSRAEEFKRKHFTLKDDWQEKLWSRLCHSIGK